MEYEANLLAADLGVGDKSHLLKAVGDKGESYISTLENQFYKPSNLEFPGQTVFAMQQHRLGYPYVLPESLNFLKKDNPIALRHDSDPASIRHHVDLCSQIILPSNRAGVKQRDAHVVEQTQSTTTTMRVLTLNMGNWERKPKAAGGHELPEEFLFQYKLIHNHSSHIVCINEAEKLSPSMIIEIIDKGFRGIRVTNGHAPAVALLIRGGSNVTVELLGNISKFQRFNADTGPCWAFFSSLFRIKFGKKYDGEDSMAPYHRHRSGAPATEEQERTIEYQYERARGFLPRPQSEETSFKNSHYHRTYRHCRCLPGTPIGLGELFSKVSFHQPQHNA